MADGESVKVAVRVRPFNQVSLGGVMAPLCPAVTLLTVLRPFGC